MTELRWILLVAGIALLAGLYLWGIRSRRRSAAPEFERSARFEPASAAVSPPAAALAPAPMSAPAPAENLRVEPQVRLDEEPAPAVVRPAQRREPTLAREVEPEPPAPEEPTIEEQPSPQSQSQKIVAVRIMARPGERFDGAGLLEALQAEGLEFGRYDIFHRLDPAGRPVFSMASLVEPGTFDPKAMPGSAYPGIAIFAVLPGPVSARQAFEELLATAHTLAGRLGGILQDDRGASLSMQRITALHEELREFDRARHARPGH